MKKDDMTYIPNNTDEQLCFKQFIKPFQKYIDSELFAVIVKIPEQEIQHMQRVGSLTNLLLAQISRMPQYMKYKSIAASFGQLAFFHDIGKAWVSPDLLLKTDKLSTEEFREIMMHPIYAKNYFEKCPRSLKIGFLRELVVDAAVYHHERWDGSGYPYGIKKENIPFISRLTSICDAYDAITNQRPYRQARSHEEASKEIEKWAGKQFDPNLAEIFLNNEKILQASKVYQVAQTYSMTVQEAATAAE